MTKDEALKLALEALDGLSEPYDVLKAQEAIREALAQPEDPCKGANYSQASEQEPVVWMYQDKISHAVKFQRHMSDFVDHSRFYETPLYTTPPQPEQSQVEETLRYEIDALETKLAECRAHQQEPVAWVNRSNLNSAAIQRNRGGQGDTHTWSETPNAYHCVPLYTTPSHPEPVIDKSAAIRIATALGWEPKRKPLTDDDKWKLWVDARSNVLQFARAIEAKLKEKNT